MAFKEFSGELDATPGLKEFSGELDKPELSLKDRVYKAANKLFGRSSVMDGFDPTAALTQDPVIADQAQQAAARVISTNRAAQTPTISQSDAKIVSGLPGVIEVGARKGYAGIGRIESGVIKAIADAVGSDTLSDIAAGQDRYADQVEKGAILRKDNIRGFSGDSIVQEVPQAAANAIGSVIQTAPTLAAGAINPAAALPILFGTTAAQEYGQGRNSGLDPVGAALRSIPMAAFEVAGEKLGGFDKIAKGINTAARGNGTAQLGSAMIGSAVKELPGEEVTTTGQFLTDKLPGVGLNQEATLDDYKKAVKDTALATLLQSGAMGAGGSALRSMAVGNQPPVQPQPEPQPAPTQPNPAVPTAAPAAPAAPVANAEAVANLASLIEQTATQDSKLNVPAEPKLVEAPADIQLDPAPEVTPQAPEVSAVAPVATPAAPVVSALPQEAAPTVSPSDAALAAAIDPMPQTAPVVATLDNPASTNEPAKIDTGRFMQITEPQAGFRPGDIVGVGGKALKHKINAQRAAKDAGQGWRVVRAGQGFVVRYQPASEKQVANGQAMAKRQRSVDTENDSLFAAIAKMGGINMDSVMKQWGYDKASVSKLFGAGIRRVVTKNGMSIDEMGQQLAEYGYLSMDEYGKHDTSELESYFAEELGGSKHFTPEGYVNDARKNEPEYNDLTEQDASESGFANLHNDDEEFIQSLEASDDHVFDAESAFSLSLEENYDRIFNEETDRLNESLSQAAEDNRLSADDPTGARPGVGEGDAQAGRGTEAQPPGTGSAGSAGSGVQQDPANYGLESYTNRDIIERLDRIERTQKEQAAANTATDTKAKADAEADTFALTGSNRQADVQAAQGQGSLFQPTAEYQTDPSIQADVERAYGGKAAYDADLASGKTELSYEQWLRVRLPAFKRAFGDWEAVHAQAKLDGMAPVEVRIPDDWKTIDSTTLRNRVNDAMLQIAKSGQPLSHPEIGDVAVTGQGVSKAISASADPAKLFLLGDLRQAFEQSIHASSAPARGDGNANVVAYEKLLANVSIAGKDLVAVFTVRRFDDGQQFYNAVTLEDLGNTPAASPAATSAKRQTESSLAYTGVSTFIRRQLERVNPDSLNGEINQRTGEPASPESFTIPANEYTDTYARQRDFFLDYGPDESQAGAAGEAAQREAVSAMDDLRSSGSVLGKALSSDYATGQRVTLVGQRVDSAEDLATLAQVYRDPRFETFRLIFSNDAGRVVSQIGLTSRLPTSTQAILGDDVDAYLKDVSSLAKARGATRYWMLHNHPSGLATPSDADLNLTRYFTEKMPGLSNNGHVVIDTNEYSFIDPFATGEYEVRKKDFGAVEPMTAGEFTRYRIHGPDDVMKLAKQLDVDSDAVTVLGLDAQMRVQRISTLPSDMFTNADRDMHGRTFMKEALAGKTNRFIVIGRNKNVLYNASKFATDAIFIAKDGSVESMSRNVPGIAMKELFPKSRPTRLSPDTSPEFDYLRGANRATQAMIARQSAWHGSPHIHDGFSLDHVGTGEGAQAFGWGLYFAGKREVAEWYRDNLSSRMGADPTGEKFDGKTFMEWYAHWENQANKSANPSEFYERMSMLENAELTWNPKSALNDAKDEGASASAIKWFKETIADKFERPGATYEVNIPEDRDMLLFDKPITGQSDGVKKILKDSGLWKELRENLSDFSSPANTRGKLNGENIYNYLAWKLGSEQAASKRLNELGIPGLKYKAGELSGVKSAGYNYVIFDDSAIKILQVAEPAMKYENSPQQEMNAPESKLVFDPLKLSDFWSTVKGESGRKQYAAGRKLWDSLDYYAKEYLGKLKLADTKPGAFKEMMRQFNVDKTKASQQAKRIAETGMSLTPEQRELLSDLVEKQAKVGDMVPEDVAKLATTMTAALDVQARDLVELGMLSEDRLVKNYLPRLYKNGLSGMLTNPTLMRSWFTKARMKIRGDRLMSRGMFEEIDANKVDQAKRLGWKVSSMPGGDPVPGDLLAAIDSGSDIPGQYRSAKVLMWRDYTESERQQMGEIRDGVLRYALGYVETQKDIAIGRLFKAIANNSDLAKPYNPGGWVKVPSGEIKGAPGTKAYGALAGMWVEPQVADSLNRNTQPKGVLMAAYDKALSFWKEGKTVWNPVSHGNNVVSNLFTIYFAGINPANPKPWRETLREYRTKGEYYTEALDNGLFGNEWANKEIQDLLMPDFADMADMETVATSRIAKVIEALTHKGSWKNPAHLPANVVINYREKMQKAYEFEDQFFKLMLYIDRRKAGMEPHAAITDAERYVFNYADMPEGVERIKRIYSPFFAYTYKAIPMVLHTAMTRPDRMLAPIMLLGGANWLAYMLLGADEEEERKGMPEYMDGRTAIGTQKAVRMPFNIGGQPAFLDMSRRVPLGDLFDINNQTGGMPLPAPFMPSHPVASMVAAVIFNKDLFTGRDLVKKSDTPWEAAKTRSSYVLSQFAPNAPIVPGSYNFNKLADATANMFDTEIGAYTGRTKSGDPIRMATVLPDVLTGTKIRTVDPQRGMAYNNAALDKEAQEIRANIRAAGRNKSMTDKSRQAYVDEQTEKLRLLGERRVELNQ